MNKKEKTKLIRVSNNFTEKNLQQLEEIQEELGLSGQTETIRSCIHMTHTKLFPSYARTTPSALVKQDKETKKVDRAEAKRQKTAQEKANQIATAVQVCEVDLNGTVTLDEDDQPVMCAYFQYEGRNRYLQKVDIGSVSPALAETQYLPNKERVQKLQSKGAIDYDLNESVEDAVIAE